MARQQSNFDGGSWALIIVMLILFWPVGLFLLFSKLFGKPQTQQTQDAPPLSTTTVQPNTQRHPNNSRARTATERIVRPPKVKKSNAWLLKIVGALLALSGFSGLTEYLDFYYVGEISRLFYYNGAEIFACTGMLLGGIGMFGGGVSMSRALKRYPRYLLVMGDRPAIAVEELSRTLGYSKKRVEKDLQKMIDKGYFGGQAYLNMELGYLFRSSEANAVFQRKQQRAAAEAAEAAANANNQTSGESYVEILQKIRRANDAIADPALSAKISRLETITEKIFQAVERDPKKGEKIGTFLNYYLPTTQKLLDSYVTFESAGVEGENLRQAKERIESVMDQIVDGFAHQLDALYREDAMDVDTDLDVMETMLHRDTATVEKDFDL